MTNGRIFTLVLFFFLNADCFPEKVMFWVASLFKAGYKSSASSNVVFEEFVRRS